MSGNRAVRTDYDEWRRNGSNAVTNNGNIIARVLRLSVPSLWQLLWHEHRSRNGKSRRQWYHNNNNNNTNVSAAFPRTEMEVVHGFGGCCCGLLTIRRRKSPLAASWTHPVSLHQPTTSSGLHQPAAVVRPSRSSSSFIQPQAVWHSSGGCAWHLEVDSHRKSNNVTGAVSVFRSEKHGGKSRQTDIV